MPMKPNYNSLEDVERQIEILQVEREIHFQRMMQNVQQTQQSWRSEQREGKGRFSVLIDIVSGFFGPIKGLAISYVLKRVFK